MNQFNESSMFFFYSSLPKKTAGIRIIITLGEKVRPEILKEALEKAVRRNPFMKLRPLLDEKMNIRCAENTAPVPLFPEKDTPFLLGTDETQGYLFRVRYEEERIIFFTSHVLSDGRGFVSFVKSVLYDYFTALGKKISVDGSFLTEDTPADPLEAFSVFEDLPDDIPPLVPKEEMREIFSVPGERTLMESDRSRYFRMRMPKGQLKDLAAKNDTTPLPLFSVLIADVIRENYDTGSSSVRISFPVDMRQFLNEKAMTNYSISVDTDITPELFALAPDERIRAVSEDIRKKIDKDEMLGRASFAREKAKGTLEFPFGSEEICSVMMKKRLAKKDTFTFLLTNMGLVKFPPEMDGLIRHFEVASPSVAPTPSIILYTCGDYAYIGMVANFEDDTIAKGILSSLKKAGCDAEMIYDGYIRDDSLLTFRFAAE